MPPRRAKRDKATALGGSPATPPLPPHSSDGGHSAAAGPVPVSHSQESQESSYEQESSQEGEFTIQLQGAMSGMSTVGGMMNLNLDITSFASAHLGKENPSPPRDTSTPFDKNCRSPPKKKISTRRKVECDDEHHGEHPSMYAHPTPTVSSDSSDDIRELSNILGSPNPASDEDNIMEISIDEGHHEETNQRNARSSLESAADALMSLPSSPAPRTPGNVTANRLTGSAHRTPTSLFQGNCVTGGHSGGASGAGGQRGNVAGLEHMTFSPFGMSASDDLLNPVGYVSSGAQATARPKTGPQGMTPSKASLPFASPFSKFITNLSPLPSSSTLNSLLSSPVHPFSMVPVGGVHGGGLVGRGVLEGFGLEVGESSSVNGAMNGNLNNFSSGGTKGPLKKRVGRGVSAGMEPSERARGSPSWISVQLGSFGAGGSFNAISEGLKSGVGGGLNNFGMGGFGGELNGMTGMQHSMNSMVDVTGIGGMGGGMGRKKKPSRRSQESGGMGQQPQQVGANSGGGQNVRRVSTGVAVAALAVHPRENPDGEKKKIVCNCKKSKCLKLYCECFTALEYCDGCNCNECRNVPEWETLRGDAIKATKAKNANAFRQKIANPLGSSSHQMGCRCKKSACLKKYCECYEAGVFCGDKCRCVSCANFVGSSKLVERRKKIKDHKGVAFAERGAAQAREMGGMGAHSMGGLGGMGDDAWRLGGVGSGELDLVNELEQEGGGGGLGLPMAFPLDGGLTEIDVGPLTTGGGGLNLTMGVEGGFEEMGVLQLADEEPQGAASGAASAVTAATGASEGMQKVKQADVPVTVFGSIATTKNVNIRIFQYLNNDDLFNAGLVSKGMKVVAFDDALWNF